MIKVLLSASVALSALTFAGGYVLAQEDLPGVAPAESLETEGSVPDLMETEPLEAADPSLEGTDPTLGGADPALEAADPTLEGADPALEAADPAPEGADPTLEATDAEAAGTVEVSDADLEKIAATLTKLQDVEADTQMQISEAIEGQGLTEERFSEISSAKQVSPEAEASAEISPVESEQFDQAMLEIETIDSAAIAQQEEIIKADGFEVEEFNQMLSEIQSDPELFEKVQEMSES
ncbi:MAG: DUF4168 domain-containing protein [Cyanobacteria bacterium J06639_1]